MMGGSVSYSARIMSNGANDGNLGLGGGLASGGVPFKGATCAGPDRLRVGYLVRGGLAVRDEPNASRRAATGCGNDPLDRGAALFRRGMGLAVHAAAKYADFAPETSPLA
jgi:hypothetical protein